MPVNALMDRVARFCWILLIPAFLLTLGYSGLGYLAIGFGPLRDGLMMLMAFPLFLVISVSLKLAVRLLWLYLTVILVVFAATGWPISNRALLFGRANYWLIIAVILTQVAYMLKKRRQRASSEETGQPPNAPTE